MIGSLLKYSIIVLFSILISCKAKKNETSSNSTCKVMVKFRSAGGGIDYTKYDSLISLLNSKKVTFTEKLVGREGEKEICIPLTELKGKEKNQLTEQLKTFENTEAHISVSIN